MTILDLVTEGVEAGASEPRVCREVGLSVRTLQRWRKELTGDDRRKGPKQRPPNALSDAERATILATMNSVEYRDMSPNQIVPALADTGRYLCSESTMYRILRAENQLAHRRTSKPPERRVAPCHQATGPNQIWSWDITYLKTNIRGLFFYLYMAVDIWSRKIVGWEVHTEEKMELSAAFVDNTCHTMGIDPNGIILHADNGSPMKGSTMIAKLYELGMIPSFSRPRVSNDNPFSESLFRTLKYCPVFPMKPFANIEAAREWVESFVHYYNTVHRHSGIKFVTPDERHEGREHAILAHRNKVYETARQNHPNRWPNLTRDWCPIKEVFLNHVEKNAA